MTEALVNALHGLRASIAGFEHETEAAWDREERPDLWEHVIEVPIPAARTILAALSAQEGMGWQPIETAPKDGYFILATQLDETTGEWVTDMTCWHDQPGEWVPHGPMWMDWKPAYWQPLPPAPLTAPQTQEGVSDE